MPKICTDEKFPNDLVLQIKLICFEFVNEYLQM